jgi:hypothetical protein
MSVANGRKSNGKWVDPWREGGRHRRRTFDRRGDRDAFRRERIRRQQLGGLVRLEHDVTLAAFIEDYWRAHAVPNLEPQTRRNYRQQWAKHILPRLGEYRAARDQRSGHPARARRTDASRRHRQPDAAASPCRPAGDLRPRRHDRQGDRQPRQPRRQAQAAGRQRGTAQ